MRIRRTLCIAVVCVATAGGIGRADAAGKADVEAAQKLFEEGLALMNQKRYAEACPRLLQSQKLDPGMGTKFRLAECYEAAGLTGSAWKLFVEVTAEAQQAGRGDRAAQAESKAAALRPKVPFVSLKLKTASVAGLSVTIDGEAVHGRDLGAPIAVDPGARAIAVGAPGKKTWTTTVRALEGGSETVEVPELSSAGMPPQRIGAIVVGIFGVGGIATGIAMGLVAKSSWDDALAQCAGGVVTRCSDEGIEEGKRAEIFSHVSTAGFVIGGVAIAAAPILWFTTPADSRAAALQLIPIVNERGAIAVLRGRLP